MFYDSLKTKNQPHAEAMGSLSSELHECPSRQKSTANAEGDGVCPSINIC